MLLSSYIGLVTPTLRRRGTITISYALNLTNRSVTFLGATPRTQLVNVSHSDRTLKLTTRHVRQRKLTSQFVPIRTTFSRLSRILASQNVRHISTMFVSLKLSDLRVSRASHNFSCSRSTPLSVHVSIDRPLATRQVLTACSTTRLIHVFGRCNRRHFSHRVTHTVITRQSGRPFAAATRLGHLISRIIPRTRHPTNGPTGHIFRTLHVRIGNRLSGLTSALPRTTGQLRIKKQLIIRSCRSLRSGAIGSFVTRKLQISIPTNLPIVPPSTRPFFASLAQNTVGTSRRRVTTGPESTSIQLQTIRIDHSVPSQ